MARKTAVLASLALLPPFAAQAQTRQPFEGAWARTRAECKNQDGPTSLTVIDLHERTLGPIFEQYENHCRVDRTEGAGSRFRLKLTCFEFWDDFRAKKNGSASRVVITLNGLDAMMLEGKTYIRCSR